MITGTVDIRRLLGVIRQFPGSSNVTMDQFLDEQTRLLVSSSGKVPGLVQVTPPHGNGATGSDAKKQGEGAVMRDIYRVYATPGRVYELMRSYAGEPEAARWWKLWKTEPAKAIRYLQLSAPSAIQQLARGWDGGSAHKAARGRNGRVNGVRPRVIVLNEVGRLRRYVNKKKRNVGLLASSIPAAVGTRYGSLKGVPGWVKRHSSSWGYVSDRKTRSGRMITLGVTKSAMRDMQRRFSYVLNYRLRAWERQLPYLIRKLEQRLQNQLDNA